MADASAPAIAAPLIFGRYRVLEALGEGRLATVYNAIDERLQRKVLLHLLRKDLVAQEHLRRRFIEEANSSAQRSHPALLEVFDSGEVQQRPFMVTEYALGPSLRSLGALTLEQALLYMRQVVGAVALCQARQSPQFPIGLPHPPISSTNVLLVDDGRVKLVESWQVPLADVPLDLAHYRAPERAEGQPPTRATVVYALGLLLYELVTGVRPISGTDARVVAQAHLTAHIPPLAQARPLLYLPTLEQLLAHATARHPGQRVPDAASFGDALDALWRDLGTPTQRLAVVQAAPRLRSNARVSSPPAPAQPAPVAPAPLPSIPLAPAPYTDPDALHPVDRRALRRQNVARGIVGWLMMLTLLLVVAFGSYLGASYVVNRVFAIDLPRPDLPSITAILPEWLGGMGEGEVLIVNSNVGLYIRNQPTLNETTVITLVPNGTPVVKLEGPVVADGVEWVRVRTTVDNNTVEGWMSLKFLKARE